MKPTEANKMSEKIFQKNPYEEGVKMIYPHIHTYINSNRY
jgi:hypothetical protein